jgi:Amidase
VGLRRGREEDPAISVPIHHDDATGLPVGVQIVAAPWREDLLLQVSRTLELAPLDRSLLARQLTTSKNFSSSANPKPERPDLYATSSQSCLLPRRQGSIWSGPPPVVSVIERAAVGLVAMVTACEPPSLSAVTA